MDEMVVHSLDSQLYECLIQLDLHVPVEEELWFLLVYRTLDLDQAQHLCGNAHLDLGLDICPVGIYPHGNAYLDVG